MPPPYFFTRGDNMKVLLQKIAKLIDVKSLISLLFAICLSVAFLQGKVNVKDYLTVCTMAFTFFFSYQNNKKANTDKED